MLTRELDFELPPELIATTAAEPRDSARLLVVQRDSGGLAHRCVRDLPDLLRPDDLLVFNHSKVIPAWFPAVRSATGGKVTGLFVGPAVHEQLPAWDVMLEARGSLRPGERLALQADCQLELLCALGGGQWRTRLHGAAHLLPILQAIGQTPLPPYIRKARKLAGLAEHNAHDPQRYNTVFANPLGSVAAPTAGLHFTPELLAKLDALGIERQMLTLHVGLGTFAPVRSDTLEGHRIHSEWIDIPASVISALQQARAAGRRIVAIGTTTVRALESLPDPLPDSPAGYQADTQLFITPGHSFRFVDALLTNFHLPQSTLLALVAALPGVGLDQLKRWYAIAIAQRYRFYSYGDAMLLT